MELYQVVRVDKEVLSNGEYVAMLRYTFSCCILHSCASSRALCKNEMASPTTDKSSNYRRAVVIYCTSGHTVLCSCCHTVPKTRSSITGLEVGGHDPLTLHFYVMPGNENKCPAVVYVVHELH